MKYAVALLLASTFLQCHAAEPPAPVIVPPAPKPVSLDAPVAVTPKPPHAPSRSVVFGGSGTIAQAAWVSTGVVAVTRTEVWRFTAEKPELVRMTPLAGPLNAHDIVAATTASSLVAVALDDSSVDLLDDGGRKRTLPPPVKPTDILALRFSPDQSTLAVTRTGASWKEETTFYDVPSGKTLGTIDGGNVVFDSTGKYVAGRGGVSTIDGKSISKFKEGFYVLGINGKMAPMDSAGGGEVVAADNVARGLFKGSFFYAGDKTVELVDPATGATTTIAAACGTSPKVGNESDIAGGRVIGSCEDGILVTDLALKTTTKIKAAVQRRAIFPPTVFLPPGSTDFIVRGSNNLLVEPQRGGTARTASDEEFMSFKARSGEALCVRGATARVAIRCDIPSTRPDGAFKLKVHDGLSIVDAKGKPVVDWTTGERSRPALRYAFVYHRGAIEVRSSEQRTLVFRLDGQPPGGADPGEPFSSDDCGKPASKRWSVRQRTDTFAAYTDTRSANGWVAAEVLCLCRAEGCTKRDLPNSGRLAESLIAIGEDGSTLGIAINSTMTETDVYLRRPKKPVLHRKIPASCIYGTIGPAGRVFMACTAKERSTIWELGAGDLAVVATRNAPPLGRRIDQIERLGDEILVHDGDASALLPVDWVKDPKQTDRATLFLGMDYLLSLRADGKVMVSGNIDSAGRIARCYDGTHLRDFTECRDEVLAR